jgi:hypothetical protein
MVCSYWWNQQEGQHKVHCLSWEKMMKQKKEGSEGCVFMTYMLLTLQCYLTQGWRLMQNPESFYAKVLEAKYHQGMTYLQAKPRNIIPYTWQSILRGIQLVKRGMIWWVGDDKDLNIWSDPWLSRK